MNTTTQNGTPAHETAMVVAQHHGAINAFGDVASFEVAQRMAKALSASTMVPKQYQGTAGLSNCIIAIELASRIGCSVFQVLQNLDVIHGRPSFRAAFLIATANASGKFSPIRFRWVGTRGTDSWGCTAFAKDRESGEECVGPTVTMAMVIAEGWLNKDGSKWKTIPELMFCYRAGGWWVRVYCPEAAIGMRTAEEEEDIAPQRFAGTVEATPGASTEGAIVATDVTAEFAARIVAATTDAELKAISKEMSKHPSSVGEANQALYVARKAELAKPQTTTPHHPKTGEVVDVDAADKAAALEQERLDKLAADA
jgi:hypothetical protein